MQEVTYKDAERAVINRRAADSGAMVVLIINSIQPVITDPEPFPQRSGPVLVRQ